MIEQFGGPRTPGVGFALGMERLLLALEHENIELPIRDALDVYVVAIGDEVITDAVRLVYDLRNEGFIVDKDYQNRSVKAQFKAANRLDAKYVVIIGEDEKEKGTVKLRSMDDREEIEVGKDDLIDILHDKLGGKENG